MAFSGDAARLYELWTAGDRPVHERLTDLVEAHVLKTAACVNGSDAIKILSLGDGTGLPGLLIAERFLNSELSDSKHEITVISADFTPDMTQQAREKARAQRMSIVGEDNPLRDATSTSVKVRFVAPISADDSTLLQSEFPDNSVDVIVMSFSLMFVPDKRRCIQEVARMLKPGGKAVFAVLRSFYMLDKMEETLLQLTTPQERAQEPAVRIADCLILNGKPGNGVGNSVEDIIEDANADNAASGANCRNLRVESSESLRFALTMCPVEQEAQAVDMWSILLSEEAWQAIDRIGEERRARGEQTGALRSLIRSKLLEDLQQNPKMRSAGQFGCEDYEPYLVTAVKGS